MLACFFISRTHVSLNGNSASFLVDVSAFAFPIAGVLMVVAPSLSSIYNNNTTRDIPSEAHSQVAQRGLLKEIPNNHGTPAVLVFNNPSGLNVDDKA